MVWFRRVLVLVMLLAGSIGSAWATVPLVELVLETEPNAPPQIVAFSLYPDQFFEISFRHSVEKTVVYERFRVESGRGLVLDSIRFQSFGAGLPFASEDGAFTRDSAGYRWEDMNRVVGPFTVILVPENQYTVYYPLGTIKFTGVPYGARLHVRIMK